MKKVFYLLIMSLLVMSCSKEEEMGDSNSGNGSSSEILDKSLAYGNLKGDQIKMLGDWSFSLSQINNICFYADGTCQVDNDKAASNSWSFAPNDGLLVTDYKGWSFHVSMLEDNMWSGTSVNSGRATMCKRQDGTYSIMRDIFSRGAIYVNQEEKDTIRIFSTAYDDYIRIYKRQVNNKMSYSETTKWETESELDSIFVKLQGEIPLPTVKILNPYNPSARIIVTMEKNNYFKPGYYKNIEMLKKK